MMRKMAAFTARVLKKQINSDANSTTSHFAYQPRVPKGIEKYKKK